LGATPTASSALHGDQMLHLLGRIDAYFLAQVADVVVDGCEEVTIDASREASADASAFDQSIDGLLQPPTPSPLGGMRFPIIGDLVGSATAELESSQDSGSRGVSEWKEDNDDGFSSLSPRPIPHDSPPSPPHHLLDHMYFASPPSAAQEEIIETIFPSDILDRSSELGDVAAFEEKPTGKWVAVQGKDSKAKAKKARRRKPREMATRRKRSRRDSSSSETTISAAETDSAYDSPTSILSPSSVSASPKPALSSHGPADDSPILSSTISKQPDIRSQLPSVSSSVNADEELGSTLDLDLLNSLLTKDILDEMGQVILDKSLESSEKEQLRSSEDADSQSDGAISFGTGSEDDDVFAGIFDDSKMADAGNKILDDFDSDGWESTFNELFPMFA